MSLELCLACAGNHLGELADLGHSPVRTGALFYDRQSARQAMSGRLRLFGCCECGHVQNFEFNSSFVNYDVTYENALHFSPTFQDYATALAAHLVEAFDIRGKRIVEIGSGDGDFLRLMCELGGNVATGYDPAAAPSNEILKVRLVHDYFKPDDDLEHYDLLICRHVLEHLAEPQTLLNALATKAPQGAVYYFEVPAAEFNFSVDGLWDCIYPHVSYFSQHSLRALLQRCGFEPMTLQRAFHGQFLSAEARAGPSQAQRAFDDRQIDHISRFAELYYSTVARWRDYLAQHNTRDRVIVWGAGSKAVNFLNAVDPLGTMAAVDINPRKWGTYLPVAGHPVLAPAALTSRAVDIIVVMNSAYADEVARHLADLDVDAQVTLASNGPPPSQGLRHAS